MRERRLLIDGMFYHVTSRTNNKVCVFDSNVGRNLMLVTLERAKEKYKFRLANFCIMPNHIHLLIAPAEGTNLSRIIQWIKTYSAKRWNLINNCTNHFWGERFYSNLIESQTEFDAVMYYIDNNPVKAGLCLSPNEWIGSGAYYTPLIDK